MLELLLNYWRKKLRYHQAYYQTAGGDYVIGTENVPGYPTGSSAASMFTPTESAASIMASASSKYMNLLHHLQYLMHQELVEYL